MTERELDTIIRLIPLSTYRQMEVISGQIKIHGQLFKKKKWRLQDNLGNIALEEKKKNPNY